MNKKTQEYKKRTNEAFNVMKLNCLSLHILFASIKNIKHIATYLTLTKKES